MGSKERTEPPVRNCKELPLPTSPPPPPKVGNGGKPDDDMTIAYMAGWHKRDDEVAALRKRLSLLLAACGKVVFDFDEADSQRYDENKWQSFAGVCPLRDLLNENCLHGSD